MHRTCRSRVPYRRIAADYARAHCSTRRRRGAEKPFRFKRVALCRKYESGRRLSRNVMSANNDGGDFLLDYTLPQHEVAEEPIPWDTKCIRLGMSALISVQARIYSAQLEQDTTKLFTISKEGLPLLLINGAKDSYLPGKMAYEALKSS